MRNVAQSNGPLFLSGDSLSQSLAVVILNSWLGLVTDRVKRDQCGHYPWTRPSAFVEGFLGRYDADAMLVQVSDGQRRICVLPAKDSGQPVDHDIVHLGVFRQERQELVERWPRLEASSREVKVYELSNDAHVHGVSLGGYRLALRGDGVSVRIGVGISN